MAHARPEDAPLPRLDVLRAPWRDRYMQALADAQGASARPEPGDASSFLGAYWRAPERDEDHHVIVRLGRGPTGGMVLLNKYPYANGHLLVALGEGRSRLLDYTHEQRNTLFSLVEIAAELLDRTLAPQGINFGINEGAAAGAGVPHHLHAHLVPRWSGDVNYMTVIGAVRVIPTALDVMAKRCRDTWDQLRGEIEGV